MLLNANAMKRAAARTAAALVEDGMTVGLGSGSTSLEFVRALGDRVEAGLDIVAVASSQRTSDTARELRIPLTALEGRIDIAVDGADAVDTRSFDAVKGLGGALTRERIVAEAADTFILIVDESKLYPRLNDSLESIPIPVAIVPFGLKVTQNNLRKIGNPVLRLDGEGEPYRTDDNNFILDIFDAHFETLHDVARDIKATTGVVEHGLFLNLASLVIAGSRDGVIELRAGSQTRN